ncbi:MAG TPA: hypothetical protein VGD98_04230 [Ktedonobacteraceae bacterium]
MMAIANGSILIQLTPLELMILIAILLVVFLLLGIAGHRQRRRRRSARGPRRISPVRGGVIVPSRRRDHGMEIALRHGIARSPQWSRVEKAHLLIEPACVVCGVRKGLQVHHIKPFHLHPALELNPTNLITLCELKGREHHLLVGHLDEWESYNVHVREDARRYHHKSATAIRADIAWQKAVLGRPMKVAR